MKTLDCNGTSRNPIVNDPDLIAILQKAYALLRDDDQKFKKIAEDFFFQEDIDRSVVGKACRLLKLLDEVYPSRKMPGRKRKNPPRGKTPTSKRSKQQARGSLKLTDDADCVDDGGLFELDPGTTCPTCEGPVPFGNQYLDRLSQSQFPIFVRKVSFKNGSAAYFILIPKVPNSAVRYVCRPNEDVVAIFMKTNPPTVEVKLPSMEVMDHVSGLGR